MTSCEVIAVRERPRLVRLRRRVFDAVVGALLMGLASAPVGSAMGAAPERVLFVGRTFVVHPGIPSSVGRLAPSAFRFDAPAVPTDFTVAGASSAPDPDRGRLSAALSTFAPGVVVISAMERPGARPGATRALAAQLARIAEAAQASGAQVLLVAHPPARPERDMGYAAAARRIEAAVAPVAAETGATLVRAGALFAALPAAERAGLYRRSGDVLSEAGQEAVALAIVTALGVDVAMLHRPAAGELPLPAHWLHLAAETAVAHRTD